ncbi:hypothetical protein G6F31_018816 [Rhizopus arrhizus]|nr:hypothetical protein G6F31_018816 [Rhizopus arrhizus]
MTSADHTNAGANVFAWGNFVTIIINFVLLAFVIFWMVKAIYKARTKAEEAPAAPAATPEDVALLREIRALHDLVKPVETLFVVDAMQGQDAVNTARAFADALPLTGVVLTKTAGDARGGAALSVRYITGKPIKFVGVSEKPEGLDVFHPDRIASRILDMGDVLSLVEQVEQQVDKDKAAKLAEKVAKGKKTWAASAA